MTDAHRRCSAAAASTAHRAALDRFWPDSLQPAGVPHELLACWQQVLAATAEQDPRAHARSATHSAAQRVQAVERQRRAQAVGPVLAPDGRQACAALQALAQAGAAEGVLRMGLRRAGGEQWALVAQVTPQRLVLALRVDLRHLGHPANAWERCLPQPVSVVFSGPDDHARRC